LPGLFEFRRITMPKLDRQHVLVTGGAGFIGSHLVDLLRTERDAEVIVLDNLEPQTHPDGPPPWLRDDVTFIHGDVRDVNDLARALRGVRYVFHLAGYGGFVPEVSKYMDVNATGTVRLYEAIRDHGREVRNVVVASSQGIYGEGRYRDSAGAIRSVGMRAPDDLAAGRWEHSDPETGEALRPVPTLEDHPHNSLHLYSISKYAEERSALALGSLLGVPTCALRYAVTYGPRQSLHNPYTGVVAIFSTQILNGLAPPPYEDGRQTRDFIYVTDNARANLVAMEHEDAGQRVFNVSTGVATTIDELARTLARIYGRPELEPVYRRTYRPSDVRHLVLDPRRLEALGWRAEIRLEEGMAHFARWAQSHGRVPERFRAAERQLLSSGVVRQAEASSPGGARENRGGQ
jgi:dTDP-L-rhamnose 4-epimerase